MNRFEEMKQLKDEIETYPAELDNVVLHARKRMKRRKHLQLFFYGPTVMLVTVLVLFVASVNMFPKFALACDKIPVLEEFVKVVCFSETITTALENKYYQEVDYKKTQNGVTLEIKYLIADERSVCVFYKIMSKEKGDYYFQPELYNTVGDKINGYVSFTGTQGKYKLIEIYFKDKKLPEKILLSGEIKSAFDNKSVTEMSSEIQIDQSKIAPSKEIEINKEFILGQEKYKIEKAVMSPLSLQFVVVGDSGNRKRLSSLDFYVQDENGRKYELNRMEVNELGSRLNYYTGSPYFNKTKELTMIIAGASFGAGRETEIAVDLLNKKASNLPDFVELKDISYENQGTTLTFTVQNSSLSHEQFLPDEYKDETGKEYKVDEMERFYNDKQESVLEKIKLTENTSNIIYFQPVYTSILKLSQPIRVILTK